MRYFIIVDNLSVHFHSCIVYNDCCCFDFLKASLFLWTLKFSHKFSIFCCDYLLFKRKYVSNSYSSYECALHDKGLQLFSDFQGEQTISKTST